MAKLFMIAAGGTGGHFYPGFVLGRELSARGQKVLFVIKTGSPNAKLLSSNNLPYFEMDFVSMPRSKNPVKWLQFIKKLLSSIKQIRALIKKEKPAVCIGMGGYISFPVVFTAHYSGVKTAVHDSNTVIGLANKICAKFTDKFLLGLPVREQIKNSVLAGTPVRQAFAGPFNNIRRQKGVLNVLIFGGSGGAKALNMAAAKTVKEIVKTNSNILFTHITGLRDYEEIKAFYGDTPQLNLLSYAENMPELMAQADILISRAGASSLAEIYSMAKPSIAVPFPYAAGDHQYYNAKIFADKGCLKLIRENPNLTQDLTAALTGLINTPSLLKEMADNFKKVDLPNPLTAAARTADIIESLAK